MAALLQGDCLKQLAHVPDGTVDMVFADLPYGVTANKWDTCIPLAPLWAHLLRVGKPRCAYVFTATQPFATTLINSQPKLFRYDLVWAKRLAQGFLNANKMPLRSHESVVVFYRASPTYNAQKTKGHDATYSGKRGTTGTTIGHAVDSANYIGKTDRHPISILYVPGDTCKVHPTQKPVALLEWLIRTYSNPGDLILDPTMGSGTTGVACRITRREFIGIEQDATYYRTACQRITGELPEAVPEQAVVPKQLALFA